MIGSAEFLQSTTGDVALLVRAATTHTEETLRLVSDHGVRCDVTGTDARAATAALVLAERNLWVGCAHSWADRVQAGGDTFGVTSAARSWLVAARVIAPGVEVLPGAASFGAALRGLDDTTRRWVGVAVEEDLFWRGVSAKGLRVDVGELARVMQRKQSEVDGFSQILGFDLLSGGRKTAAWLRGFGMKIGDSLEDLKAKNICVAGSTMPPELWAAFTAAARPLSQVYAFGGFAKHVQPGDVVFPQYGVNAASTGRMSARNPAIQNLTRDGRCVVLASLGRELWSADHVSAEIAVLAGLLGDPDLATRDIYTEVAAAMGGVERKTAKPAVLAWLYGQRTAARAVLLGSESAAAFELAVASVLPDVLQFRENLEKCVLAGEQIFTLYGRPLPFLSRRDSYKALNLVVQGSARDAFGVACRNVAAAGGEFLQLFIPVHDEVICSVPAGSDAAAVNGLLTEAMGVLLPGGLIRMRSDVEFLGGRWGAREA